nr:MAG TPA: hypothetical protein [Caudoviricetes sp.]
MFTFSNSLCRIVTLKFMQSAQSKCKTKIMCYIL